MPLGHILPDFRRPQTANGAFWCGSALFRLSGNARVQTMSALPPKADIADAMRNVRFVPKADIVIR
jgi:hypothetical protein